MPARLPVQKRNIRDYFCSAPRTPSQPGGALSGLHTPPRASPAEVRQASSPTAHSTIQETPTIDPATSLGRNASQPSRSPTPTTPGDPATRLATRNDASQTSPEPYSSNRTQSSRNAADHSKRVVSNGEPVVLNSDSDSDSLPDLDHLFDRPAKNPPITARATAPRVTRDADDNVLRSPPKRRKDDSAFRRFVQMARQDAEMEQEIAQVQADLDKAFDEGLPEHNPQISAELVANAVHDDDDPEKAKKLYLAMQRTNALHADCVFHFFHQQSDITHSAASTFPTSSIRRHELTTIFTETTSRNHAFLSGFAQQVFRRELPEDLAIWMIDQVCNGTSGALGKKYLQLLGCHQHHLEKLNDVNELETIFLRLGAEKNHLHSMSEIAPSHEPEPGTRHPPACLTNVCALLQFAAPRLRIEARLQAIKSLWMICMDNSVQADAAALHAAQLATESLTCSITTTEEFVSVMGSLVSNSLPRIKHPILQRNLVLALPSRSPLTASIQRYLALSFLLYPTEITRPLGSPEVLGLIHAHIQSSPGFRIRKDMDYAVLAARFTLLDVAIGPGPLAVPYVPLSSPPASQDSVGLSALAPTSAEQRKFNKEVDALAQQIRLMGNSINVAGAITDLNRLAANDCCDRLCTRLENAVRIGGRKVKKIFSKDEEESEHGKVMFRRFLVPKKSQNLDDGTLASSSGMPARDSDEEVSTLEGDLYSAAATTGAEMSSDSK